MPIYMIERTYAEQIELTAEEAANIKEINDDESVRWIISFLSADKKKTFCLYEASNMEAIREAARRAGLPVDAIIEVNKEVLPSGQINTINERRYSENF
jgi:hypothetical protein